MQEELAQVKRKLAVTEAPAVRAAEEILKGIK
jgi:hypothetical protein